MGAWGTGIFDNDAAYDFEEELADDPRAFFVQALDAVCTGDTVGDDEAHAALVTAAHIDALLHGTTYRHDDAKGFAAWRKRNRELEVRDLAARAVEALENILNDSVLDDEWSQSPGHAAWRREVKGLRERLSGAKAKPKAKANAKPKAKAKAKAKVTRAPKR